MRNVLIAVCWAAAVAAAANPFRPLRRGVFAPQPGPADFEVGFWDRPRFDPLVSQPALPPDLSVSAYPGDGSGYYLVQFSGPVRRGQVDALRRAGGNPVGFHSRYLGFVKMNRAVAAAVARLPFVRWVGVYQPGLKFWSRTLKEQGFGRVVVILFYPEDVESVARELQALGCVMLRTGISEAAKAIEVDCSRDQLPAIARLTSVCAIEEWHEPRPENENAQWVVQDWQENVRRVWDQSIHGVDEILGYTDGQIDPNHYAFRDPQVAITDTGEFPTHRKVAVLKKYPPAGIGTPNSHGTHVGGTIAGDDSVNGGNSLHDGHSKSARLVQLSPIPTPPGNDFTEPLNIITNYLRNPGLRPRTISNSWWTGTMGQYTNAAATFDQFAWKNKDVVLIKSCGNQGQTGQYRITEPGNSKSIVACASLQNGLNATVLSSYSSRGPGSDGRIKPDISAPGEGIYSAQSGSANGYVSMSGTSMAAPCVNGNIGLMRSYLRKGFYPSGSATPADTWGYVSAALLKAMTLVSADPNVGSYVVPSEYIGWGRMDVDSVLFFSTPTPDARKLLAYDDTTGLETGDFVEFQFFNFDSMPLRASVVWTDTAAAPGANPALINNLDCRLTAPNGDVFKGNLYASGQSVRNPPGSYDALNPLEMFRVNSSDTGTWTLRVEAQNVVTQRQPFAVVVTGAVSAVEGSDVGVRVIAAPVGSVDSGAVVVPACTVYNYGPTPESYEVRMRIGAFYDTTAPVSGHAPGTAEYLEFPAWTAAPVGSWTVACSTMLAGDANPGNNRKLDSVRVVGAVHDVGVAEVLAPRDTVDTGAVVTPRAVVRNYGNRSESFPVWMWIGGTYSDSVQLTLEAGATDTAEFRAWTAFSMGMHLVVGYTQLAGDAVPANDTTQDTVWVVPLTGLAEAGALPVAFAFDCAGPSLFRQSTALRYALPRTCRVSLGVYDAAGMLVRELAGAEQPAGFYRLRWDGRDGQGRLVARGVYYCRLRAGEFRAIRKLVRLD